MKRTGAAATKIDGHNPTETTIEMLKQIVGGGENVDETTMAQSRNDCMNQSGCWVRRTIVSSETSCR